MKRIIVTLCILALGCQCVYSQVYGKNVVIFDVVGRELMRVMDVNNLQTTLNVESLHNGMYFIKITAEDGMQQIKKFVKQR